MKNLGEKLCKLRNIKGLKMIAVKKETGIDDIGRYEKNERVPSLETLVALAKFYNASLEWLLYDEGEIFRTPQPSGILPVASSKIAGQIKHPDLPDDEMMLLEDYRMMTKEGQIKVHRAICSILNEHKKESVPDNLSNSDNTSEISDELFPDAIKTG